jgi:drug/metabolite transporter (DMT)-like permease
MSSSKRQGALFGLAAALLFGISPPVAKLLLPESGPMVTAGLLYLGAGLGLLLFEMITKIEGQVLQSNIKGYRGARRPSLAPFRSLSVGCHGEAEP